MVDIPELIQKPNLGGYVELYEFDLTKYDAGYFRVLPGSEGATVQAVTWNGNVYSPWAIESEGWAITSYGPAPRPSITLGNTSSILTSLVVNNNDLVGCIVKRIRTYERYLDGGPEANVAQTYPIEEYKINQRTALNDEIVSFELSSHLDQENMMLPGRQIMREYCPFTVRRYTGVGADPFDYDGVICPFVAQTYLDVDGNPVANAEDEVFSKKLGTCCKARFGENAELPFGGFPGVARVRIRS